MREETKIRGLGASQPQGPTRKGQGVTHHCPPPTPALGSQLQCMQCRLS